MYKTSLLATGGFNEKCGILGVGTKQFTLSLEEFKDALHLLNYMEIDIFIINRCRCKVSVK